MMHFVMCRDATPSSLSVPSQSSISFCDHQRSSQHRWSRSPRVFKKKMPTSTPTYTPPYTRKNSGMLLLLVGMSGCRDDFHGVVAMP
jgi:hypothetical protein